MFLLISLWKQNFLLAIIVLSSCLPQVYNISPFGYVSTVIFDTVSPGLGSEVIGTQSPFGQSVGWDSVFFVLVSETKNNLMGKRHTQNTLKIENSPGNCDSSFSRLFFMSKRGILVYKTSILGQLEHFWRTFYFLYECWGFSAVFQNQIDTFVY